MSQKLMLLKLQIKRAMKTLPHLLLTGIAIAVVVVGLVLVSSKSRNEKGEFEKMKVAVVPNGNSLVEDVGIETLDNMDTAKNMFDFEVMDIDTALRKMRNGKISSVIDIPENFVKGIQRGENIPAKVYLAYTDVTMTMEFVAELVNIVGELMTATESTSYAMQDLVIEYNDRERLGEFNDYLDVTAARVILLREGVFERIVIYGEDDVSITKGYACAALVILLLLWGLSCGSILKSDGFVFAKKMSANMISLFYQEMVRFIALMILLCTMVAIILGALIAAFPFAGSLFEMVDVTNVWQLVMLLVAFIPCVILAATIIMFAFAVSANQIGGILLLFVSTIGMGYASGCFLPSVFLPDAVRNLGTFLPTFFMHRQATLALNGTVEAKTMIIIIGYSVVFFFLGLIIKSARGRKV